MRLRFIVAAIVALVFLAAPVMAFDKKDNDDCAHASDPDRKSEACTRLLKLGNLTNQSRSILYSNRGSAWIKLRDFDHAITDYNEAIRLDPKYAVAYSGRGNAWNNKLESDRAIADYSEAIRLDPNRAAPYNGRGNAWNKKRDFDHAIIDFNEAIRLDPKYVFAYSGRAYAWFSKRDFDHAITDYNEAIRLDPKYVNAYAGRGIAYSQLGDNDRALADADRAIEIDPNYANGYGTRGIALSRRGDFDRAIDALTKGISLNPKLAFLYLERSLAFRAKSELDRALTDVDTAIKVEPDSYGGYNSRCSLWNEKDEFDNALADCDRALKLKPDLQFAYGNRGTAWLKKGDIDRALNDLNQAIRIDPTYGVGYSRRADIWRAKGQLDKALLDLDQAIRIDAKSVLIYTIKGQVLEARGEIDEARAAYKNAVELPPVVIHLTQQGANIELSKRYQDTARSRLVVLSGAVPSVAPAPIEPPSSAPEQKKTEDTRIRIALVIGNGAYRGASALPNPPNDARALSKTLRAMGFEVAEGIDLDRAGMDKLMREFLLKAPKASIALLFYAGHGIQIDGKNYLVPVDANVTLAQDLTVEMTALDTILAGLDDSIRTNIIILDACRDNPLVQEEVKKTVTASRSLKIGSGLAAPGDLGKGATLGAGTLIAFATAPGAVALDGEGANSPFSTALAHHISTPGLEVQQMLTRVRAEVVALTQNKQVPWSNSSLLGDIYLVGGTR